MTYHLVEGGDPVHVAWYRTLRQARAGAITEARVYQAHDDTA